MIRHSRNVLFVSLAALMMAYALRAHGQFHTAVPVKSSVLQINPTEPSRAALTQQGFIRDLVMRKAPGDFVYVKKDTVTIYCSSLIDQWDDYPISIRRYCYERDFQQDSNNPEPGYQDPPPLSCNPGDVLFAFQALPDTGQTVYATQEEPGINTGFGVARPHIGNPFAVSLVSALDGTSSNPVKLEIERYAVCIRTSRLGH